MLSCVLFPDRHVVASRKLLKTRRGSGHNSSFRHNRSFKLKKEEGGGKNQ